MYITPSISKEGVTKLNVHYNNQPQTLGEIWLSWWAVLGWLPCRNAKGGGDWCDLWGDGDRRLGEAARLYGSIGRECGADCGRRRRVLSGVQAGRLKIQGMMLGRLVINSQLTSRTGGWRWWGARFGWTWPWRWDYKREPIFSAWVHMQQEGRSIPESMGSGDAEEQRWTLAVINNLSYLAFETNQTLGRGSMGGRLDERRDAVSNWNVRIENFGVQLLSCLCVWGEGGINNTW